MLVGFVPSLTSVWVEFNFQNKLNLSCTLIFLANILVLFLSQYATLMHFERVPHCGLEDWHMQRWSTQLLMAVIEESSIDLHLSSQLIFKGLHSCWHLHLHQWLKLKVNSGGNPICDSQKLQQALLVLPMSSCEMSQNKSFLLWKPSRDSEEGYC